MRARAWLVAAAISLGAAMLPACLLDYRPGVSMELSLAGARASGVSHDGARFDGLSGSVHWASLELVDCENVTTAARSPLRHASPSLPRALALQSALRALGPARARAHGGSTATGLAPGAVELGADPIVLGAVSPGPNSYCALTVRIEPADEVEGGLRIGQSLSLTGRATRDGSAFDWVAVGPGNLDVEVPITDAAGQPVRVVLDAADRSATLELSVDWSAVLSGVDVVDRDPADLALDLVVGLRDALQAHEVSADAQL